MSPSSASATPGTAPGTAAGAAAWQGERWIAADHPAFDGHFPGQPILPGVCVLAEVVQCWHQASADATTGLPTPPPALQLASAKFLSPVAPGSRLRVQLSAAPRQLRFEVTGPSGPVASGAFTLAG